MRVSVVQMNSGADKLANIDQARALIASAVEADRPNIVSLPEVWDSLGGDRATRTANAEILPPKGSNEPGGEAYEFLRDTARSAKVHVHGGSIIEQGSEKLFNTTVVFNPDGTELARYRKMHLFDIVAPDGYQALVDWIPGAAGQPHVILEGGGHFLQEDLPEEYGAVLCAWLAATE